MKPGKRKASAAKRTPGQSRLAEFRKDWKAFQRLIAGLDFKQVVRVEINAYIREHATPEGTIDGFFTGERMCMVTYREKGEGPYA